MLVWRVVIFFTLCAAWNYCSAAYPDDQIPRLVVKNLNDLRNVAGFTGKKTEGDPRSILDVQEVRFVDDNLLLGTRNAVFVISRESLLRKGSDIFYDQVLYWFRQNNTMCEKKTGSVTTCQNYIRVVAPLSSNSLLLCGTNAAVPLCREYVWNGNRINNSMYHSAPRAVNYRIPFDDLSSLVYRVSDGDIYIATRVDFNRLDAAISRSAVADVNLFRSSTPKVVGSNAPHASLRTERSKNWQWLDDPQFVGMVETQDKMLIFFREVANEASAGIDKIVYSRVAQVCKQDQGGTHNLLVQKWTSFFKARLNCSIPGNRPFYFSEIKGVTDAIDLVGGPVVFAIMNTPENSISGSAVCAFRLSDIERTFSGNFWEQNKTSFCWNRKRIVKSMHPTKCRTNPIVNPYDLRFAQQHPIMYESVGSLGNHPVFMTTQSRSRFTAITVETYETSGSNITMMYIGTDDGKLLKVASLNLTSGNTVLSEKWFVYQSHKCSRPSTDSGRSSPISDDPRSLEMDDVKNVQKILLVPKSDELLVAFRHCVMKIPKQACFLHTREKSCVDSANPYCHWTGGKCGHRSRDSIATADVSLSNDSNVQSSDSTESTAASHSSCFNSSNFALSLVVGILSTFSLVLLLFLIFINCRSRRKLRESVTICTSSCTREDPSPIAVANQSAIKEERKGFLQSRRSQAPRVSIEPSSHPINHNRSSLDIGQEVIHNGAELNVESSNPAGVHVVQNLPHEGVQSGEESTWSEDLFDSDKSSPLGDPPFPSGHDKTDSLQFNGNNNRAVGVAYPMNQRSTKLSQIVHPTFVSAQSKIKLGSKTDYGSVLNSRSSSSHTPVNKDSLEHSRIVTNPNYLPVSPFVSRTSSEPKPSTDNVGTPSAATFKTFTSPTDERSDSIDSNFPPLPPCVLPVTELPDGEGANTLSVSTSWYPSPPAEEDLIPISSPASVFPVMALSINPGVNEKTPLSGSSKNKAMSSSTSGDSNTSGFVSSSPKSSFKDKSSSARKGLIVAKGILSAQSYAPIKKKNKKKKDGKSKNVEKYSVADKQQAIGDNNWPTPIDLNDDSFEDESSEETQDIPERSPEFAISSEEETATKFSPHQEAVSTPKTEEAKAGKAKKPIKLFKGRRSKKWKKDRIQGTRITDEDTFMSPAYDEEPFVPTVVGWEEIEYTSPAGIHGDTMTSFQTDRTSEDRRAYDDSYVELRGGASSGQQDYGFYTMRPKGRMRRKMPKMRNTDKEWALTNNPLPVPTPAVPDMM
uniref:Uncharacterized protein LOC100178887 n=1 Tax=Phallusia mammillata TaxID=59560 RepID=A0A6F9DGD9_9ASCI|nr:uncharacterized protein LOC100178887 [Phallusia mammillata]